MEVSDLKLTVDNIKLLLKDIHEKNLINADSNKDSSDDLSWMSTSLEDLYKMLLDSETYNKSRFIIDDTSLISVSKVVRVRRMVDVHLLDFNKVKYVFMSGIYVTLHGVLLSSDEAKKYLNGGSTINKNEKSVLSELYYPGAMQAYSSKSYFIPKKDFLVPETISDSHSYTIITF